MVETRAGKRLIHPVTAMNLVERSTARRSVVIFAWIIGYDAFRIVRGDDVASGNRVKAGTAGADICSPKHR